MYYFPKNIYYKPLVNRSGKSHVPKQVPNHIGFLEFFHRKVEKIDDSLTLLGFFGRRIEQGRK